ncbi:MAG: leucine-rich repeat domain-containing protein [Ruminococcaceae bacterium]|nr:leucine-rich repeat domain-containing protein [Oscillospiraceae bacterium]
MRKGIIMKISFKASIALLLSIVMLITMLLTGCNVKNSNEGNENQSTTKSTATTTETTLDETTVEETTALDLTHTHAPSSKWYCDETYHWNVCSAKNCTEELHKSAHIYDSKNKCTECWYRKDTELKFLLLINEYVVSGYTGSSPTVVIPSHYKGKPVGGIGNSAFEDCESLKSIVIPDTVTRIGNNAFCFCSGLTSIKIPDRVTSIGDFVFCGCPALTSITISDSVTSIGLWAFNFCDDLTSITVEEGNSRYHSTGNCLIETATKTLILGCKNSVIPDDGSVTSIDDYAFSTSRSITSITSITIPDSITSIGDYAFSGYDSLASVYYSGTPAEWSGITIGSYNSNLINATLYYYSATQPTDTAYNYWRYVDGVPAPW